MAPGCSRVVGTTLVGVGDDARRGAGRGGVGEAGVDPATPPPAPPAGVVVHHEGRSGRAFVLVMVVVMVVLAVTLSLVSRSYSGAGSGAEPGEDGRPPVTAAPEH